MTIKGFSRKQIIISISIINSEAIVLQANTHISNINRLFKSVKSEVSTNFIYSNNKGIIITTKVVMFSDLNIVERYVKELENINLNNVISLCLLQFKLYLKILEVLYFLENTNLHITSNIIEEIIKDIHIFNNIVLASYPHFIKISSKSDMAIIWVNICNSQNSTKAKYIINRYFNIGHHITTIRGTSMDSGISQYKNC